MTEEKLLNHIVMRLSSQIIDYVEMRNSATKAQLLQLVTKPKKRSNDEVVTAQDAKYKLGLTHVLYHDIDTGNKSPVVSQPYRYDRVKLKINDYHVNKMLEEVRIIPIQSPYTSPVVLCSKNNGLSPDSPEAYHFVIDYRKLNAVTKYPRYPLPLIDDLTINIPHTWTMPTWDLRSRYFQLAVNHKDIPKTAFVNKNRTYAFTRMPFGLSGAAPNFQKAIYIGLKPIIERFVSVCMGDVIILSPSFTHHVKRLREV
ncbi:retrovirus-related Pol polyprotein from transposon 297 [Trichonephila clavipes]|nr:retrovirus-related Pol polyprotein from transposon 297 [Trichonephila clavipes]